jgi:uncharacterized protein YcfL
MKKLTLILLFFFVGCIKNSNTPTPTSFNVSDAVPFEIVKRFVNLSATAKTLGDKVKLVELCGGEFKNAFDRISEDEFKLTYLTGQIKVENIEILDSSVDKDMAKVHYRVSIENKQGTETTQETNEREAILKKSNSGWVIEAIRLKGSDKLAFTRGMMF